MTQLSNLIISLIFFNLSCKTTEDQLVCLKDKNRSWEQTIQYKEIQIKLDSTLQEWIDSGIEAMRRYRITNWKIDETVFFNSKLNHAILLVLRQDTAVEAKMDFIDFIYAKQEGAKWKFFYKSMPSLHAERYYKKENPLTPYTFGELSMMSKKRIIESGYFKNCTCEINDTYINDWYNEDLEKKHQEFLNNK